MSWLPKKSVVVPFDFSEQSAAAVDVALQLTDDPSHVHVIHVLPRLSVADPGVVWQTIDDDSRKAHAEEAMREKLAALDQQRMNLCIAIGDAGHEIVEFAQAHSADLIVMPSHGRTGLQRLLIGSVAERVIRLSSAPVLVLRQ